MDFDRAAASRILFGFQGTAAPPEALELCRRGAAGAILFKENVESPRQLAELSRSLKAAAGERPFLVSVDQEGGRVQRLRKPWTEWPPMRILGESGDATLAREVGRALGAELSACGIDLDYAPVLDVDTNPANPVIGDRSFGRDPAAVARMGVELALGLQEAGVAACAKHFPGHGDTSEDSHLTLPRLGHDMARLRTVELVPFAAAARAGVASVMTAHVVFDAVDPEIPATMSARAMALLRVELGFGGVIVSDDLEMKAVADRWAPEDAVFRSAEAGVDAFLCCHRMDFIVRTIDALRAALESGALDPAAAERSSERVAELSRKYARPASAVDPAAALAAAGRAQPMADKLRGPALTSA